MGLGSGGAWCQHRLGSKSGAVTLSADGQPPAQYVAVAGREHLGAHFDASGCPATPGYARLPYAHPVAVPAHCRHAGGDAYVGSALYPGHLRTTNNTDGAFHRRATEHHAISGAIATLHRTCDYLFPGGCAADDEWLHWAAGDKTGADADRLVGHWAGIGQQFLPGDLYDPCETYRSAQGTGRGCIYGAVRGIGRCGGRAELATRRGLEPMGGVGENRLAGFRDIYVGHIGGGQYRADWGTATPGCAVGQQLAGVASN